jgi:integrase/recombinase XerD
MRNNLHTLFSPEAKGEKKPGNATSAQNSTANDADAVIRAARVPSVTLYRRHRADCPHLEDRYSRDCKCVIWMYWSQGDDHRRSTKTRSWKKAERIREEFEHFLDPLRAKLKRLTEDAERTRVKLADAIADFLSDAATVTKSATTRWIFKHLLASLSAWCESNGIHYLDEIRVPHLRRWRSTWISYRNETIRTYQAKVKKFFRFCVEQEWLGNNPMSLLTRIKGVPSRPTDYFNREEFEKLVEATYSLSDTHDRPNLAIRLRTMLLLRRWSGLRLGDAVPLERSRLMGDCILLRQSKTTRPVFVPLPHDVAQALREIPAGRNPNPRYFFWDGLNKGSAVHEWEREFNKLFRMADLRTPDGKPKRCHGQMLRDTFSVELLLAGVRIEEVSALLPPARDENVSAFFNEPLGCCQRQAARSTGDDCNFPFKLSHDCSLQ